MSTASWLGELNPQQRAAVEFGDGALLIIAGAGTGKTKTLACRVAHLIERGVAPDGILLLTFTRRAAAEMLHRAGQLIDPQLAAQVWGGTFHAIANRLLRTYGRAVGLSPDFTVMDQSDAADVMNLVRSELGLASRERRFPRKETLIAIYSRTVNAQEPLTDVLATRFPAYQRDAADIANVFDAYTRRKTAQQVLDYDDLLLFWEMLCQETDAGRRAADRFAHVLVDEYQDTNAVQARILRALRARVGNICVVGDDAQSIYSFRAAEVRNILDFPNEFPGTQIVTLEQNYRSTQPILAASNAVMEQARQRYTKILWSQRASRQLPQLAHCTDEAGQSAEICRRVLANRERGVALRQQAVLFRASHHSAHLEIELTRRNIPFHKYGGLKFVEAAHVKDLLALLRVLENPHDEISWFRVLLMLDGVGPRTARRIMDDLGVRSTSPGADVAGGDSREPPGSVAPVVAAPESAAPASEASRSPLATLASAPPAVPSAAIDAFAALRGALLDCLAIERAGDPPETDGDRRRSAPTLAVQVERLRRYLEPIFRLRYDNSIIRLRDLEQLERIASGYSSRSRLISDLTLDPPNSTSELAGAPWIDDDYLILSTIHSAKGCEWTAVHVIHASDGNIPSDMALSDDEGLEEERRLFYVALTRAKDQLCVYFPLRYYYHRFGMSDRHTYAQLSRFLTAPVRALFEEVTLPVVEQPLDESAAEAPQALRTRLSSLWRTPPT
ncbi:MAG: DNA helicase II [Phycisphaerae bacterium]|nr:DNA helicase II [Phycisphaerae bacterium]